MSSVPYNSYEMHRRRVLIAERAEVRLAATERFILSCVNLAEELRKFRTMREEGMMFHREARSAVRYVEDQIREVYRIEFGAELGAIYLPEPGENDQ